MKGKGGFQVGSMWFPKKGALAHENTIPWEFSGSVFLMIVM